jgi:protein-tyrosine phosphatase
MEPTRTPAVPSVFNFRDLGGYAARDGRTVRWHQLYRSDSLHRLGDDDREVFRALGVRTVIDLRRPTEITRDGRVPAYDGLAYHHIHPEHAEWTLVGTLDEHAVARWLADRYNDLARTGAAGIATALRVIATAQAAPVVVHCVAGKDRTGVVCALTLALLGVADEDIAADYAMSTAASARFHEWLRATTARGADLPTAYLSSPAETMLMFLNDLRTEFGSVEGYVKWAGLTSEQVDSLIAHLLTPAVD